MYRAMLAYRSTPLENELSLAELRTHEQKTQNYWANDPSGVKLKLPNQHQLRCSYVATQERERKQKETKDVLQ